MTKEHEHKARTMTNEDIKQHDTSNDEEETIEAFNLTNLAQKGAPTYVDFKTKEEYLTADNTTKTNNVHGETAPGRMNKLKSLFNRSSPDLSPKKTGTKTSIRKWFSFSKVEDLSKSISKSLEVIDSNDKESKKANKIDDNLQRRL